MRLPEPIPPFVPSGSRRDVARPLLAMVALTRPQRHFVYWGVVAGLVYHLAFCASAAAGAWLVGRATTGASAAELTPRTGSPHRGCCGVGGRPLVAMWVLHEFAYTFVAFMRVGRWRGCAV